MDTYSLVLEDSSEVPDNVDDAEDEAVLGADREVRPPRVSRNRLCGRRLGEQRVHCSEATDLRAGRVNREYEDEDDGEENASVGAARAARESVATLNRASPLTSRRAGSPAYRRPQRRSRRRAGSGSTPENSHR